MASKKEEQGNEEEEEAEKRRSESSSAAATAAEMAVQAANAAAEAVKRAWARAEETSKTAEKVGGQYRFRCASFTRDRKPTMIAPVGSALTRRRFVVFVFPLYAVHIPGHLHCCRSKAASRADRRAARLSGIVAEKHRGDSSRGGEACRGSRKCFLSDAQLYRFNSGPKPQRYCQF